MFINTNYGENLNTLSPEEEEEQWLKELETILSEEEQGQILPSQVINNYRARYPNAEASDEELLSLFKKEQPDLAQYLYEPSFALQSHLDLQLHFHKFHHHLDPHSFAVNGCGHLIRCSIPAS